MKKIRKYAKNEIGQTYNRLTIKSIVGKNLEGKTIVSCDCICGRTINVIFKCVTNGNTKSCGCSRFVLVRNNQQFHRDHKSKTYTSWLSLIRRCTDKNDRYFYAYGGRGISVDNSWLDYVNFKNDMGERPANCTIDRIDVNGNYNKENCRWADNKTQARNKRNNHLITIDGQTKCLFEWMEFFETSVDQRSVVFRMKSGWPVKDAFCLPRKNSQQKCAEN